MPANCQCDHASRFVCYGNLGGGGCPCHCHHPKRRPAYNPPLPENGKLTLGNRIASARKRQGLSQSQLARRLGSTIGTLSLWERGRFTPSPEYMVKLCQNLETGTGDILAGLPAIICQRYTDLPQISP